MSALTQIRALYEYDEWANGHVLERAAELTEDELDRTLGASFESVRGNLAHVAGAQVLWLTRWRGEPWGELPADGAPLDAIQDAYQSSHAELREFIASLSESDLEGTVRYRDTRGEQQQVTLWRAMLQVANHGTHHRAETALLLTALGHAPRQLDYVFYEIERAGGRSRLT